MYQFEPHESSIGHIQANVMVVLIYLITLILGYIDPFRKVAIFIPLVLFFVEKESEMVKFYAMQLFLFYATLIVAGAISALFLVVFTLASSGGLLTFLKASPLLYVAVLLLGLSMWAVAIISMIKAYQYEIWSLPLVGKWARRFSGID